MFKCHYLQHYCGLTQYSGAGSGMCIPTPQQRISDYLFSPSGDHKILTRIYVKGSIVPCHSLVRRLLLCPPFRDSSSSRCPPFLHQPSSRRAFLLSFSKHISRQLWCGNKIYRPEEQSSMIILRRVSACWDEPELLLWRSCSMSPVAVWPELLIRVVGEWVSRVQYTSTRATLHTEISFFSVFYMFVADCVVQWWEQRTESEWVELVFLRFYSCS